MAKKSTDARLAEIWQYVNATPIQEKNVKAAMVRNNITEDAIAAQLSMGWWVKGGSPEKRRRQAVRANTFLTVVNLKTRREKVPEALRNSMAMTQDDLDQNIQNILKLFNEAPRPKQEARALTTKTQHAHMPSMKRGNTQRRQLAERSVTQASDMISTAWPFLIKAQTPGTPARAHYAQWFGAYDRTRYQKVKSVLQTIHTLLCSGEVCLHLRTTDQIGKSDDTPGADPSDVVPAAINTVNGAYQLNTLFAWAIPKGADGKPHIFLCDVFYATNGKGPHDAVKTGEDWSDNIGGVMIHELSHALSRTKDKVHPTFGQACYGRLLCSDLATNYPDDAIDNADNYEIFCEDVRELLTV